MTARAPEIARAFVAVVPPSAVLDAVQARVAPLRESVPRLRWARRVQWHVTLRFLGAVPDVAPLADSLREAVGSVASLGVRLGGGGAFPNPRRASVLWLGVNEGAEELAVLAAAVETACVGAGFAPEERAFRPHVTLARANGRPRDLRPLVDAVGDAPVGPAWSVDEVVLVASDTRPGGAVYDEVARFALAE